MPTVIKKDLEWLGLDELFIEIAKRTRNAILIVSIDCKKEGDVENGCLEHGSHSELMGLVNFAHIKLLKKLNELL